MAQKHQEKQPKPQPQPKKVIEFEGSVEATIKNLTGLEDCGDYVYLGGHRPVNGNYKLRQNGLYIQFHNPGLQNVAIVKSDKKFNPNLDIVEVAK